MPAASPRNAIKNAFAALLLAETTGEEPNENVTENASINWADRVYSNRKKALPEGKLPALNVQVINETSEKLNEARYEFDRTLTVAVACIARADDAVDDILEEMAYYAEEAILKAFVENRISGINRVEPKSYDANIDLGSAEIAAAVVAFSVRYDQAFLPDLDDLEGFNITVKAKGGDILFQTEIDVEVEGEGG